MHKTGIFPIVLDACSRIRFSDVELVTLATNTFGKSISIQFSSAKGHLNYEHYFQLQMTLCGNLILVVPDSSPPLAQCMRNSLRLAVPRENTLLVSIDAE